MTTSELTLATAIGAYPHTRGLKDGSIRSARLRLDHAEVTPIHRAFRPMVNDLAYDVSEMALVTYVLALASGRPLVGLPVVLMRNSPHAALVGRAGSGPRSPRDLAGCAIGVRAYTQTTGVWVRAILAEQYGVDLAALRWVTLEPAHVDGFRDPPNVTRATSGQTLEGLLRAGGIDAAIGLGAASAAGFRPLVPDGERETMEWTRRTGITPINHVVVVKATVARAHPWVTGELRGLFDAARQAAGAGAPPSGLEAHRPAIEAVARHAVAQGIAPRAFTAEELFGG
jgi:4,5-dihydroxyphthalate decarboxylase